MKKKKINPVDKILMERDGMSLEEAKALREECAEALLAGDGGAIEAYLGLEDDYIFDILDLFEVINR